MAIDDFWSRDTGAFVLPTKTYYPTKIPIAHYQLRHFISCPEPDLIYYASGADIYCLNTATQTQAHVVNLPWEARCTASGHGYVCVGGAEQGNFAAIKASGFSPSGPSNLDGTQPADFQTRFPGLPFPSLASSVRLEKIGEDIVNSISIHKLPAIDQGQDDIVAVLTNNDKTVRLYSLLHNLELTVLDLPFAMNHATLSPDGQILVAVGDAPVGVFFERSRNHKIDGIETRDGRLPSIASHWHLLEQLALYRPTDSRADGYFTTAWSPSGRLCAVGSECGYISVFDVELLKNVERGEDAMVRLISSTRPDTLASVGAVRTMQFSPAPWDFLIWSEDQGRVCVADLRSGLKTKQVLVLDSKEESMNKVEIVELETRLSPEVEGLRREAEFIRRYRRALDSEGTTAAVNAATEYFEADSRRSLHRRPGVVESDNDPHGLTAQERQILELSRTTRPMEEARGQGITPRSITYNTAGRRNSLPGSGRREAAEAMTEFMNESQRRSNPSPQDRIAPRRQASVIVSTDEDTTDAPSQNLTHTTDSAPTRSSSSTNILPGHAHRVTNETTGSTPTRLSAILPGRARRPSNQPLRFAPMRSSAISPGHARRPPSETSDSASTQSSNLPGHARRPPSETSDSTSTQSSVLPGHARRSPSEASEYASMRSLILPDNARLPVNNPFRSVSARSSAILPGHARRPPSESADSASAQSSSNILPGHARRVTNEINTSTDDAWRTIGEALANQGRANNRTVTSAAEPQIRSELRRIRQLNQMRERLRNARASQPSTDTYEFGLGLRRPSRNSHDSSHGARTAGLAMSHDGRTLYCGTEEGIFEFKMNLHIRMDFPAMKPR